MAKKQKRRKLEPQTLAEFRAWLSGVEEMQCMENDDGDWTPNADQWELIRQRIDNIVESEPEVKSVAQPMQHAQPFQPQMTVTPAIMQGHSQLDSVPPVPDAPRIPQADRRQHIDTGDRIAHPTPHSDKLPMGDKPTEYKSSFV